MKGRMGRHRDMADLREVAGKTLNARQRERGLPREPGANTGEAGELSRTGMRVQRLSLRGRGRTNKKSLLLGEKGKCSLREAYGGRMTIRKPLSESKRKSKKKR